MTTNEFNFQFDILYDNIRSQGAPGVNSYEKSIFLTQAQEDLVKEYYASGFENTEKKKRDILNLTIPYSTSVSFDTTLAISENSTFFTIPDDTWYIIHERLQISSDDDCLNNSFISVKPVTHDEYNVSVTSPFRKPNKRKAWRLDISLTNGTKVVEIVSSETPIKYSMRYIKKPSPIILANLTTDVQYSGMGLTIDGLSNVNECQLNSEVHRTILNRAVNLAMLSYRENSLQNRVQLNKSV